MLRFVGAGVSDVGRVRPHNEDSGFVGPYVVLVADGVGGAAAGEIASATAAYSASAVALGWLGHEIRRWVLYHHTLTSDFTVEFGRPGAIDYHGPHPEAGWRVSCVDTGVDSLTGTRTRQAALRLDDGPILVSYGDCVSDVATRSGQAD